MSNRLDLIDRDTTGNRCDVTPLFADPAAFAQVLDHLIRLIAETPFDVVVGVDALGFILGAGIALRTKKGLVVARKTGKLPLACDSESFIDYTGHAKGLEMRFDALHPGTRALIVDEWVETGAQVGAVIALIERRGGVVAGIAALNIDEAARPALGAYPCFHLHAGV
jgi:adenine phosphoribosyltransferase